MIMNPYPDSPSDKMESRTIEYRKVVKPLLEKRRRARMNHSLNELKNLIVEARKTEISDASKLEKADILELTVRHLQDLRRQHRALAVSSPGDAFRFRDGFAECAHEVSAFLASLTGLDSGLKGRLFAHLTMCIRQVEKVARTANNPVQPIPVHPERFQTPEYMFSPVPTQTVAPPLEETPMFREEETPRLPEVSPMELEAPPPLVRDRPRQNNTSEQPSTHSEQPSHSLGTNTRQSARESPDCENRSPDKRNLSSPWRPW